LPFVHNFNVVFIDEDVGAMPWRGRDELRYVVVEDLETAQVKDLRYLPR